MTPARFDDPGREVPRDPVRAHEERGAAGPTGEGPDAPDAAGASAESAAPTRGRRRADPRLTAYLVAGLGGLIAALATGQYPLAALAAPFLALAVAGLVEREPTGLRGEVWVQGHRVIEGDPVEGEVRLEWEGEAEVEVMLAGWRGVTPVDPSPALGWSLAADGGPVVLPFRLTARSWGSHSLGTLRVRVRRPGGLVAWEHRLASAPVVRVLPSALRLDRLLRPAEPRAVAGMHLSRSRGHGTDFADFRRYQPGDRLRDLSWGTSARFGEPWVTVHHPERTGTVLLLLDAFFSSEPEEREALARAARAAWAVASVHLQAQDRVGLLVQGRAAVWVPPQGGRRARWLLLDELLSVGGAAEELSRHRRHGGRVVVPADALIVGVTSLRSRIFMRELIHHRRGGHATAALVVDTADLLPRPGTRVDAAARRIWFAQREAERQALERSGVPTALVTATGGVAPAISNLRRRMSAVRLGGVGVALR